MSVNILNVIELMITLLLSTASAELQFTLPQLPYIEVLNENNVLLESEYGDVLVPIDELRSIEATAYCITGTCADGTQTTAGVTAAMAKEYIGCTAYVWERTADGSIGNHIGVYEIHDTGGDYRIKNGTVIDIYIPSYDEAVQFGRQDVYVYLVFPEE